MKKEIDLQLSTMDDNVAVLFVTFPDEMLRVPLNSDDFHTLREQVNEAWLNMQGYEMRCVTPDQVEEGDIIPSLGAVVHRWKWTDTARQSIHIFFQSPGRITLSAGTELTVHRMIS